MSKDPDIVCKRPGNPDAVARAISCANAGVFGKTLVFDRSAEKDGQPTLGTEPTGAVPK